MTGNERRWMNPNRGLVKRCERAMDILVSRYIYPWFGHLWNPYSWFLQRSFVLAETKLTPIDWPHEVAPLRVLLITDIHAGIFLKPESLWQIIQELVRLKPDLVIIGGDLVSGHVSEAVTILDVLTPLTSAPLGAWFCFGNHDYFGGDPDELQRDLANIGITTLKNESAVIQHGGASFILGGIDDRLLGEPDWQQLLAQNGPPHLLMAHNPDHFYEAEARGIPLTLSGHTHGGQIRIPGGPAIIRQSRYCLDEGLFAFGKALLVVSQGLGCIGLPIRWGADPEAVLIEITAPERE